MSFDDMRQQSEEMSFFDDEDAKEGKAAMDLGGDDYDDGFADAQPQSKILGMTAPQRFIIAVILLMMACILSAFCLLVTEKIVPVM